MLTRLTIWIGLITATLAAAPIEYTITFTKTGGTAPNPSGGSFIYDADAPLGAQFSLFNVTWGPLTMDMLTEANANANTPFAPSGSCLPAATSASTFTMLSGSIPCHPTAQTTFDARVDPGAPNGVIFINGGDFSTTDLDIAGRGNIFLPFGSCSVGTVGEGCVNVSGTVSIAPTVPEPATWLLTVCAIGILWGLRRHRPNAAPSTISNLE